MSKKILIVDDNIQFCEAVKILLEHSGFTVVISSDAINAFDTVKTLLPDFIILDVMMPGVLGSTLCHSLKKDPKTKSIPVFVTTGLPVEGNEKIESLPADQFLEKPFDNAHLLNLLNQYTS